MNRTPDAAEYVELGLIRLFLMFWLMRITFAIRKTICLLILHLILLLTPVGRPLTSISKHFRFRQHLSFFQLVFFIFIRFFFSFMSGNAK